MTIPKDGSVDLEAVVVQLANDVDIFPEHQSARTKHDRGYYLAIHRKTWEIIEEKEFDRGLEDNPEFKQQTEATLKDLYNLLNISEFMSKDDNRTKYEKRRKRYEASHPQQPREKIIPPDLQKEYRRLADKEMELDKAEEEISERYVELEAKLAEINNRKPPTSPLYELWEELDALKNEICSGSSWRSTGLGLPGIDEMLYGVKPINKSVRAEKGLIISLDDGTLRFGTTDSDQVLIDVTAKAVEEFEDGYVRCDKLSTGNIYLPRTSETHEVIVTGNGTVTGEISFKGSLDLPRGYIDAIVTKPLILLIPDDYAKHQIPNRPFPDLGNGYRHVAGGRASPDDVLSIRAHRVSLKNGLRTRRE